jgi:hypothetical protein
MLRIDWLTMSGRSNGYTNSLAKATERREEAASYQLPSSSLDR